MRAFKLAFAILDFVELREHGGFRDGGLGEQLAKRVGFLLERLSQAAEALLSFFDSVAEGLPLLVGEVDGVGVGQDKVGRKEIRADRIGRRLGVEQ